MTHTQRPAQEDTTTTMPFTRSHAYRGQTIYPCERVPGEHRGRWIVQTYHQTGTPWADQWCPHYQTLAEAREGIDDTIRYAAEAR